MRLKSDLLDVLEAAADERLDSMAMEWDPRPAATVVMAAEGYPGHYEQEREIQNLDAVERICRTSRYFTPAPRFASGPARATEARIVSDGGPS